MSTSTMESRRVVRGSKKRKMVDDANRYRASSETAAESANTLVPKPSEQGGPITESANTLGPKPSEQERSMTESANTLVPKPSEQGGSMTESANTLVPKPSEQGGPITESANTLVPKPSEQGGPIIESANTLGPKPSEQEGSMTESANTLVPKPSEQGGSMTESANTLVPKPSEQGGSIPHAPIDVDAIDDDDDVVVTTPAVFAQARNKSRRNRQRAAVIDVESADEDRMLAECLSSLSGAIVAEEHMSMVVPCSQNRRRRFQGCSRIMEEYVHSVQAPPPPPLPLPPPPPEELVLSCPICMGPFNEAMTTKCGHIFCNGCLKAAIAAQKKCPTCRAKITTMRSAIRVYLPRTRYI